jgi:hypothetical protein
MCTSCSHQPQCLQCRRAPSSCRWQRRSQCSAAQGAGLQTMLHPWRAIADHACLSQLQDTIPTALPCVSCHVQILRVSARDQLEMTPWRPPANFPAIAMMYAEVGTITDKGRPAELAADPLIARLIRCFQGQVSTPMNSHAWGGRADVHAPILWHGLLAAVMQHAGMARFMHFGACR